MAKNQRNQQESKFLRVRQNDLRHFHIQKRFFDFDALISESKMEKIIQLSPPNLREKHFNFAFFFSSLEIINPILFVSLRKEDKIRRVVF